MTQSPSQQTEAERPQEAPRDPGSRKEDWITNQLRRVYDDALQAPIPQEMLELLNALDQGEADGVASEGEKTDDEAIR